MLQFPHVSTRRPHSRHHACTTAPPQGFFKINHEMFSDFNQIIKLMLQKYGFFFLMNNFD